MIPELREQFNNSFNEQAYRNFLNELNSLFRYPADFRVSETPLFLSDELNQKLIDACNDITKQVRSLEFKEQSKYAVPESLLVPNEDDHPEFFQIDFAICKTADGEYIPRLVELQAFPTIYAYQYFFVKLLRKHFPVPDNFTPYYNNIDDEKYAELFRKTVLGECDPENVILLEITPEKQKTRIDFAATESLTGITTVGISKLIQRGRKLFYKKDGKEIPVERIYNRVIFDELLRSKIEHNIDFKSELDVKWAAHPNWFFRISKYSLPLLKGEFVPNCYFLDQVDELPNDLHNYVLKPLFSFAGHGVEIDLTKEMLKKIEDPQNYILQEKINYAPLIKTPDEYSKVEIRMMYLWNEEPLLVNNLIRMSKGKMMGVDYNKDKTWVGSSSAFHRI